MAKLLLLAVKPVSDEKFEVCTIGNATHWRIAYVVSIKEAAAEPAYENLDVAADLLVRLKLASPQTEVGFGSLDYVNAEKTIEDLIEDMGSFAGQNEDYFLEQVAAALDAAHKDYTGDAPTTTVIAVQENRICDLRDVAHFMVIKPGFVAMPMVFLTGTMLVRQLSKIADDTGEEAIKLVTASQVQKVDDLRTFAHAINPTVEMRASNWLIADLQEGLQAKLGDFPAPIDEEMQP